MGVNLRSLPLIWPLNSILPRGFPPENRPGRLNHVCVSPVNELPDNPPLLYSRLTAPVDFKRTLHHSHCPAPQGLSAVSGEMVLEGLKIRQLVTSMRLLSAIGRDFPFPVWRMRIWSCIKDCFKFPILEFRTEGRFSVHLPSHSEMYHKLIGDRDSILVLEFVMTGGLVSFEILALTLC